MKKNILYFLDHRRTDRFFVFLILLELLVCQIDTMSTGSNTAFKIFFNCFEIIVMTIFTIEYILRVFALDRFKNLFRPLLMIDLLTLVPVTGLIFVLALSFSSLFAFAAEQSTAHFALRKMPPSSLWSIITFAIYSYHGTLPLVTLQKFASSITPGLGLLAQFMAVILLTALVWDFVKKKYDEFNLRKMTIRREASLVDI